MFDWLEKSVRNGPEPELGPMTLRLALGLAGGFAVAWLYRRTRNGSGAPSLPATLVLMAVLIAAVTQVIGDNVARAFSLVGALSIVRFRTVVRDTRDTAFVIFAVVVGMAFGSGHAVVGAMALLFTGAAAWVMRVREGADEEAGELDLTVRVGLGMDFEGLAGALLREHLRTREEIAASTARQGAALEFVWRVTLVPGRTASELVRALNRIEGIQSVEIRRAESER